MHLTILTSLLKRAKFHLTLPCETYRFFKMSSSPSRSTTPTDVEMEEVTLNNKRTTPDQDATNTKKSKNRYSTISLYKDPSLLELWFGFPAMETLAYEASIPPIINSKTVKELTSLGYIASEAKELLTARMSFLRVAQKLWPTTRPDQIDGQHVNITQLPFDIEVHPDTHLSLDYNVLLHFEKPETSFTQDCIMQKVLLRLQTMNIDLGDQIGEPVAV